MKSSQPVTPYTRHSVTGDGFPNHQGGGTCLTTLDKPGNKPSKRWPDGHPAALWYGNWEDLALAIGSEIPSDSTRRGNLRRDIRALCRELEKSGAIEARPHPIHEGMKGYHLALTPDERWAKLAHAKRVNRGANNPTGGGPNRPTFDAERGAESPPGGGPNRPTPYRGEQEEPVVDDLAEDASPLAGAEPPVATGEVADDNDSRVEFQAARQRMQATP